MPDMRTCRAGRVRRDYPFLNFQATSIYSEWLFLRGGLAMTDDNRRDDDYDLDRDYPEDEHDERAPDDVVRRDNADSINDWLRRSRSTW